MCANILDAFCTIDIRKIVGWKAADSDARITVVVCIAYVFVCQAKAMNPSWIRSVEFPHHVSGVYHILAEYSVRLIYYTVSCVVSLCTLSYECQTQYRRNAGQTGKVLC